MRRRLILPILPLAIAGLVLAGCATQPAATTPAAGTTTTEATVTAEIDSDLDADAVLAANEDATVVNDDEWSAADAVDIALTGSSVSITEAGVYRLSGSLEGSVVVTAPDDALVVLILDDADITNTDGAAIEVVSADDVVIALADGSENSVSDASSYADDAAANAAIHVDADLTVTGSGSLEVSGNGNDGIVSTDDLAILSGAITVDAADDALRGKDALVIEGGTLALTAGGDALKSDAADDATRGYIWISGGDVTASSGDDGLAAATDAVVTGGTLELTTIGADGAKGISAGVVAAIDDGEVAIDATDDGVHADGSVGIGGATVTVSSRDDGIHAEAALEIRAGSVTVAQSEEGLEATDITIAGGDVDITADDDGVNASGGSSSGQGGGGGMADSGETLTISGGTLRVEASGDGLDSNGSMSITGGDTIVFGPTNDGNGALDSNGGITVSGGTLLAVGSAGMAESPDAASPQQWIAASVSGSAGDEIEITDAAGTVLASVTAEKAYASVVFTSPDVVDGAAYTVLVDGSAAATATEGTAIAGGMGGGPGAGRR
ncbi:carbohydrate-binding domain-containing protein [Microbacterium sp. SS28]|uniref:carbohydrate-binding domain-containing protein n=1 Tax=Microbacterium sp. SS28 TaxID=2919948 RepID=UPI001FAAB37F|nr:carbohydrate-binding domain-containing protein [Microbacterium sp. SS28]